MKKRLNFGRLGAMALALTLITTCLMGGTLAKYTTTVAGEGTATVAKWAFEVNGGTEKFTVDLGDTTNRTLYESKDVKEGVIAPGTSGKFDIEIDGTGSEVGIDYSITLADANNGGDNAIPEGIVFSTEELTDANKGAAIGAITSDSLTGTIDYSDTAADMKKTVSVYWKWNDAADNDNASAGKSYKINISVTGTQAAPTVSTPTS